MTAWGTNIRFGREAVFNDNVFTQDFFTENATHKQNCTSFNPKRVITYYVNNGKPFLDGSRSLAQIIRESFDHLHIYATLLPLAYPSPPALAPLRRPPAWEFIRHCSMISACRAPRRAKLPILGGVRKHCIKMHLKAHIDSWKIALPAHGIISKRVNWSS